MCRRLFGKDTGTQGLIREKWFKLKRSFVEFRWQIRTQFKLWVLEKFRLYNPKTPIYISEWSKFDVEESQKPGWLDVCILVPRYFGLKWDFQWVFTVNCFGIYQSDKPIDDMQSELWDHNAIKTPNPNTIFGEDIEDTIGILKLNYEEIYEFVRKNRDVVLRSPIIEFEEIWTNQEFFNQEDVVKYTKIWLEKFYPALAGNKIEFVSP